MDIVLFIVLALFLFAFYDDAKREQKRLNRTKPVKRKYRKVRKLKVDR